MPLAEQDPAGVRVLGELTPVHVVVSGFTLHPVVAVSDYMRAVPQQLARWVPQRFHALGADGFGFADTRPRHVLRSELPTPKAQSSPPTPLQSPTRPVS